MPQAIYQGDPFVVRAEGPGPDAVPSGAFGGRELLFGSCGSGCYEALGIAPVNMDPGVYNIMVKAGNRIEPYGIKVKKKAFAKQSLTLPPDKVTLSPEDEARADREADMLRALWKIYTEKHWTGPFIMPLDNSFSTAFGVRRTINRTKLSIHSGVDIRGAEGEPVLAANAGIVAVAEELFFGGNTMVIDHGQGIYSVYMHLSAFRAETGQAVNRGDVVALVGSTGRSTGPHLHYTVKLRGVNANPSAMAELPLKGDGNIAAMPYHAEGSEED